METDATPDPSFQEWLATRPECVQKLAARHRLGARYNVDGVTHWLIGYTENDMIIVSPIDPSVDYDGANENRVHICASHFE
jgi:hypothetical protein